MSSLYVAPETKHDLEIEDNNPRSLAIKNVATTIYHGRGRY